MDNKPALPRVISWTGYLSVTFLLALPLAVLTVRSGIWQQGLMLYALSCLGAALVLALCAVLMLLPRFAPWRIATATRALLVLPGSVLLLVMLASRGDYPAIHDISTDTDDPPVFTAAVERRGKTANSLAIDKATLALQATAYPDLRTLRTDLSYNDAFAQAVATAQTLGWDIYREDSNAGFIEAVDTTAIMGFSDDIVLRLRTDADGTLVDMRSVSRVGISDLGANARRIETFQRSFGE